MSSRCDQLLFAKDERAASGLRGRSLFSTGCGEESGLNPDHSGSQVFGCKYWKARETHMLGSVEAEHRDLNFLSERRRRLDAFELGEGRGRMETLSSTWWVCPLCSRPFSPVTAESHIAAFHLGSQGPAVVWRCGECGSETPAFTDAAAHCLATFHAATKLTWTRRRPDPDPEDARRTAVAALGRMQAAAFQRISPTTTPALLPSTPLNFTPVFVKPISAPRANASQSSFRVPSGRVLDESTPRKRASSSSSASAAPAPKRSWKSADTSLVDSPFLAAGPSKRRVETIELDDGSSEAEAAERALARASLSRTESPTEELELTVREQQNPGSGNNTAHCVLCNEVVYNKIEIRTLAKHVVKCHGKELNAGNDGLPAHSCGVCSDVFSARPAAERHLKREHPAEEAEGATVSLDTEFISAAWAKMLSCFPLLADRWPEDVLQSKRDRFSVYF